MQPESEVAAVQKEHAAERLAALERRTSRTSPDTSAGRAPMHRRKRDVRQVGGVQVVTIRRRSPIFHERPAS
jgi:hypothetical protein